MTRGVHRSAEATDPWLADLRAWSEVLPLGARFTGLTAARLHGLWLPELPRGLPAEVRIPNRNTRPRRAGLRVTQSTALVPPEVRLGLAVDPVESAIHHACRYLSHLDALILVDSALRTPGTGRTSLLHVPSGARGIQRLRRAVECSDRRSESAWETVLREFHRVVEAPVVPQHHAYDADGNWLARGDLWFPDTKVLHEYDGGVHRDRSQHQADLRRDRRLSNAGWVRRGYTSGDLVRRAAGVLRDIDMVLGRQRTPHHLDAWHELLTQSCLTSPGKRRLLRAQGVRVGT